MCGTAQLVARHGRSELPCVNREYRAFMGDADWGQAVRRLELRGARESEARAILTVTIETGARPSEICNLNKSSVLLDAVSDRQHIGRSIELVACYKSNVPPRVSPCGRRLTVAFQDIQFACGD